MKGPRHQAFVLISLTFTGTQTLLPGQPPHLHEREGDGKQNILWGWPKNNPETIDT